MSGPACLMSIVPRRPIESSCPVFSCLSFLFMCRYLGPVSVSVSVYTRRSRIRPKYVYTRPSRVRQVRPKDTARCIVHRWIGSGSDGPEVRGPAERWGSQSQPIVLMFSAAIQRSRDAARRQQQEAASTTAYSDAAGPKRKAVQGDEEQAPAVSYQFLPPPAAVKLSAGSTAEAGRQTEPVSEASLQDLSYADPADLLLEAIRAECPDRPIGGGFEDKLLKYHLENFGADPTQAWKRIMDMAAVAFAQGLRDTTKKSYSSGIYSWEFFCRMVDKPAYPATEPLLVAFAAWSAGRIQADSISNYLSAIRQRHIELGLAWPERSTMPVLSRVLHGLEWLQRANKQGRIRLALTADILEAIILKKQDNVSKGIDVPRSVWDLKNPALTQAIYNTAFVGLLRPSEAVVKETSNGNTSPPLRVRDFSILRDVSNLVTGATLQLTSRKTDCLGVRCDIALGLTGNTTICAVRSVINWLEVRRRAGEIISPDSFLFPLSDDGGKTFRPVSYNDLDAVLRSDLKAAGYDSSKFAGHSFRIGAATTLAHAGVPANIIEDMGGWARGSAAVASYMRDRAPANLRRRCAAYFFRPFTADPATLSGFGLSYSFVP